MMKLSLMKKVMDTVDEQWRSSLGEIILKKWQSDTESLRFARASANFICIFERDGERYFLRFNEASERSLSLLEAEIELVIYLAGQAMKVAVPVKSLAGRYIETVETEIGTFYGVAFKGLSGTHHECTYLHGDEFSRWGQELGRLHHVCKTMPQGLRVKRPDWRDHLNMVRETVGVNDLIVSREVDAMCLWAGELAVTDDNFGLIHFDFELDNLCWNESEIGILDFDDCANYWYVADIAYALRDLFNDHIDLNLPDFRKFIEGYTKENQIDLDLLTELPQFMRLHNLYTFARLDRAVDLSVSEENPDWMNGLIQKLLDKMEMYRRNFC